MNMILMMVTLVSKENIYSYKKMFGGGAPTTLAFIFLRLPPPVFEYEPK